MTLSFRLSAAIFAGVLALAGCEAPTSGGASGAAGQYRAFLKDAATAEVIAENCPSLRMRNSSESLVAGFVDGMLGAGYSPSDLVRAQGAVSVEQVALEAATELTRAGVVGGNPASFCAYGRGQMQQGTRVGSFLR